MASILKIQMFLRNVGFIQIIHLGVNICESEKDLGQPNFFLKTKEPNFAMAYIADLVWKAPK